MAAKYYSATGKITKQLFFPKMLTERISRKLHIYQIVGKFQNNNFAGLQPSIIEYTRSHYTVRQTNRLACQSRGENMLVPRARVCLFLFTVKAFPD